MVRSDTAIGMLCRFHLRLKASVDLLSKNTVQVPGSIGVTEENNICDTYSCANIRKRNQIGTSQRSYSPGRRLCLANSSREYASSVKVTTPLVKHITSQKSRTHQLPDESLSKLAQNVVSCERPGELKGRAKRIMKFPPHVQVCMREGLNARSRHDL